MSFARRTGSLGAALAAAVIAAGVVAVCTAGEAEKEPPAPEWRIPRAAEAPAIDGVLDDAVWKAAKPVASGKLGPEKGREKLGDMHFDTTIKMAYDDKYLYIAIVNLEPQTDRLSVQYLNHEAQTWRDDANIIDIRTEPGLEFYSIQFNSAGTVNDSYVWNANPRGWKPKWDERWESHVKCVGRVTKDAWDLEMAIPWAGFPGGKDKATKDLRISLTRKRKASYKSYKPNECESGFVIGQIVLEK